MFLETYGPGPWPCDHCGRSVLEIKMGVGCVHHRDDDKTNDAPGNLGAMHTDCHVRHHRAGRPGNRRGAKLTLEQRRAISDRQRGKPAAHGYRPEVIAKMAASKRGQSHVEARLTCECGKTCHAGPMKQHQRATGHVVRHEEIT